MIRFKCDPSSPAARVALITGANTGIGRVTALELARHGFHVFLACRSLERTQPVLDEIRSENPAAVAEWIPLELSDFESVRTCAKAFLERQLPLHLLVNNAGSRVPADSQRLVLSSYLGSTTWVIFVTQLLLERLKDSAPARIVTAGRIAGFRHRLGRRDNRRPACVVKEYCVSSWPMSCSALNSGDICRVLRGDQFPAPRWLT
jgi:NAD(P)-dependent dehydrogenase (short-subunit alcohol dehydrogenase family)